MNPTTLLLLAAPALGWVVPDDAMAQRISLSFQSPAQLDIQQIFNAFTERLESRLDELEGTTLLTAFARKDSDDVKVLDKQSGERDDVGVIDQVYEKYLDQKDEAWEVGDDLEYRGVEEWVKYFGMDTEDGEMLEVEHHKKKDHDHEGKHHGGKDHDHDGKHHGRKDHDHDGKHHGGKDHDHDGKHHGGKDHDHEGKNHHGDDHKGKHGDDHKGKHGDDHKGKHGHDGDHEHSPHDEDPPYSGPPKHRPHMPPRDHTGPHTNSTLWDLISSSKHTTRFASLLKKDSSLQSLLSSKSSNITVFAPSNHAISTLEKHLKKGHGDKDVPPDVLHRVLSYHIANGTHRSQDLRYHNTLITRLPDADLGEGMDQRVRIGLNHKGPSLNFYSQFTMFDIFAQNGVVHGIDAVLLPPPDISTLISLLPTAFSTSEAALSRTGLLDTLPKLSGSGLTVFLPSNCAWSKLGYKLNGFLFSRCGEKYLRAIMKYHIVVGRTLYSDALDVPQNQRASNELDDPAGLLHGYVHVDLPTLLKDRHLSVDITRLERFLSFRVNGLNSIVVSDGLAKSGVIQVPDHVLIPPHSLGEHRDPPEEVEAEEDEEEEDEEAEEGTYSISQLKRILAPYVENEQEQEWEQEQEQQQESSKMLWGAEREWEGL
ncbi:FAS1 domain-containing protein [Tricharina praecox]|uniref:FAS1 domain-containing protein n=1 Tax=Tricharina praecox TaxID=43433 RepID=UPI00221E7646|nr:FAS1 domain-containing protein [Tricharina praecox]KAI5852119.1 FAS1 domain-containing protein [Tricharina praecox]